MGVNGSAEDPESVEREAQWRLTGSRTAETAARARLREATDGAARLRADLAARERRLRAADSAAELGERADLRARITRLEGMLSALVPPPEMDRAGDDVAGAVLNAAVEVLDAEILQVSAGLFAALNRNVADLAGRFGVRDLERVAVDRAGRMRVFKSGGPREWFSNQSPGERLRLRIALVVALLRVGTAHGIATHPGLLMIDSPRSEEVQDADAAALLTALDELCRDTPGLQVILTTVDDDLIRRVLAGATVIAPPAPGAPLW